jgi:hypothetical protein
VAPHCGQTGLHVGIGARNGVGGCFDRDHVATLGATLPDVQYMIIP